MQLYVMLFRGHLQQIRMSDMLYLASEVTTFGGIEILLVMVLFLLYEVGYCIVFNKHWLDTINTNFCITFMLILMLISAEVVIAVINADIFIYTISDKFHIG